jgi:hypothetical protein
MWKAVVKAPAKLPLVWLMLSLEWAMLVERPQLLCPPLLHSPSHLPSLLTLWVPRPAGWLMLLQVKQLPYPPLLHLPPLLADGLVA